MNRVMIVKKRILILCEDKKSSLLYFQSFKKDEEFKRFLPVAVDVFHPENCSPLGLVKDAIRRQKNEIDNKNGYDELWVVFDKNSHTNIPQAYTKAERNKEGYKINIALSVICFEFWILLHYCQTMKPFNKCDSLIIHIKKNHLKKYKKCENCFDELKDLIHTAVKNGKWVEKQVKNDLARGMKIYKLSAYTNVHHIVQKLIPQK